MYWGRTLCSTNKTDTAAKDVYGYTTIMKTTFNINKRHSHINTLFKLVLKRRCNCPMKQRSAHGIQFKYKPIHIIHIGTTGSHINTDPNGNPLYGVIRNERVCCARKQKQSKSEQNHIIRTTRLLYQLQQHNNKFSKTLKRRIRQFLHNLSRSLT